MTQSATSFRGMRKHEPGDLEIPGLVLRTIPRMDCFGANIEMTGQAPSLNPERVEGVGDVGGRSDVNGQKSPRPRAFDVLGEIVKEHDASGRHADRLHHMIIGLRIGFPKPDRGGQKDFAEMTEHDRHRLPKNVRHGGVGIGEGVKRQAPRRRAPGASRCRAFRPRISRSILPGTGRRMRSMPSDGAQAGKERVVADLALLVTPIEFVAQANRPARCRRLAAGVTGPAGEPSG